MSVCLPPLSSVIECRDGKVTVYSDVTDYTEPISNMMTTVEDTSTKGKGLFAACDVPEGTVVSVMRAPGRMRKNEWLDYHESRDLPHDAGIEKHGSPLIFYDRSWWDGLMWDLPVPKWYFANHSTRDPTMAMKLLHADRPAKEQEVVWMTTRRVCKGEELTFEYTDPPSHWE